MKGQIVGLIRGGASQAEAAQAVGLSSETIRREKRADPTFDVEIQAARAEQWDAVQSAMYKKSLSGNVQAAKLWKEMFLSEDLTPDAVEDEAEAAREAAIEAALPDRTAIES